MPMLSTRFSTCWRQKGQCSSSRKAKATVIQP
jgi:hypothetical protein